MRVGLDSNILVYVSGAVRTEADVPKVAAARRIIARLSEVAVLVAPLQALGETFVVLRRMGVPTDEARARVSDFATRFAPAAADADVFAAALDLVADHRLEFWDALIVMSAARARCALLLSEDMQDGFATGGLIIVNPLAVAPNPNLAALIQP